MTVEELVKEDIEKKIRYGRIKRSDKATINALIVERTNYYTAMENMRKNKKLSIVELLTQLAHGPFAIIDFLVFHPIKSIKAIIQALFLGILIYIVYKISKSGNIDFINVILNKLKIFIES